MNITLLVECGFCEILMPKVAKSIIRNVTLKKKYVKQYEKVYIIIHTRIAVYSQLIGQSQTYKRNLY